MPFYVKRGQFIPQSENPLLSIKNEVSLLPEIGMVFQEGKKAGYQCFISTALDEPVNLPSPYTLLYEIRLNF